MNGQAAFDVDGRTEAQRRTDGYRPSGVIELPGALRRVLLRYLAATSKERALIGELISGLIAPRLRLAVCRPSRSLFRPVGSVLVS